MSETKVNPIHSATNAIRVLLIEDQPTFAHVVRAYLLQQGMDVEWAANGAEAHEKRASFKPEIMLVDLELPDISGFDLVSAYAGRSDCGIIVVTANGEEAARIAGLDSGADDYFVKSGPTRELAARIHALHRRLSKPPGERAGRVFVDAAGRIVTGEAGKQERLTEAEMVALETLLDAAGAAVSRDWLSKVALRRPMHMDDRAVDQLVLKLRRKLSAVGAPERLIMSSRNQGYIIGEPSRFRRIGADGS
ncbi:MAG: response regulator transcription factor [Rhodospirillales bacterium]|nr:response regulator transcription factor [Rhodospirillales bacterium]